MLYAILDEFILLLESLYSSKLAFRAIMMNGVSRDDDACAGEQDTALLEIGLRDRL